jgi:hypothetical protein
MGVLGELNCGAHERIPLCDKFSVVRQSSVFSLCLLIVRMRQEYPPPFCPARQGSGSQWLCPGSIRQKLSAAPAFTAPPNAKSRPCSPKRDRHSPFWFHLIRGFEAEFLPFTPPRLRHCYFPSPHQTTNRSFGSRRSKVWNTTSGFANYSLRL